MPSQLVKKISAFGGAAVFGGLVFGVLPQKCSQWQAEAAAEAAKSAAAAVQVPASTDRADRADRTDRTDRDAKALSPKKGNVRSPAFFRAEATRISELADEAQDEAQDEALSELMASWVAEDLAGLKTYVESLPAGEFRRQVASAFMETWAATAPKEAAAWLSPKLGTGQWPEAVGALCSTWSGEDPAAAAEWAQGLTDTKEAKAARDAIATAWGEKFPLEAVAWLEQLPSENQGQAASHILGSWASTQPELASQWLAQALPKNPNLSADLGGTLVTAWVDQDAGGASRWLNQLPEGPLYDTAATIFAQSASSINPKDALPWAKSLGNEETRKHTVVHVMEEWYTKNATAFYQALPKELDNLDPNTRRAVYEMLYQRDPNFKTNVLDLTEEK